MKRLIKVVVPISIVAIFAASLAVFHFRSNGPRVASQPSTTQQKAPGSDAEPEPQHISSTGSAPTNRSPWKSARFESDGAESVWHTHVLALGERADHGDHEASRTLYEESLTCWQYHHDLDSVDADLKDRRELDSKTSNDKNLTTLDDKLAALQEALNAASTLCAGSPPEQVEKQFRIAVLRAARQGYLPAERCYIALPPASPSDTADQVEQAKEFLHFLPIFMHRALEKGDWLAARIALARLSAETVRYPGNLRDEAAAPDPYLVWRAMRLGYYRAKPEQKLTIEGYLNAIASQYKLSIADMERADDWARTMATTHFSDADPLDIDNQPGCL